jgi:hypothetical protein
MQRGSPRRASRLPSVTSLRLRKLNVLQLSLVKCTRFICCRVVDSAIVSLYTIYSSVPTAYTSASQDGQSVLVKPRSRALGSKQTWGVGKRATAERSHPERALQSEPHHTLHFFPTMAPNPQATWRKGFLKHWFAVEVRICW